ALNPQLRGIRDGDAGGVGHVGTGGDLTAHHGFVTERFTLGGKHPRPALAARVAMIKEPADFAGRQRGAYILNLTRYTDKTIPVGKHIYTETCLIAKGNVVHICPSHNKKIGRASCRER